MSVDAVTAYAAGVASGEIIAGPHVRDACTRHLNDLKEGAQRGLRWDAAAAEWVFGYFRDVLRLSAGEHEGKPFELHASQKFIVGSLFGWKREDASRRFRLAFIEQGKGSGKTPLAAGIGHYMTGADGESRAQTFAAATNKDQADNLFKYAVSMAKQSPEIAEMVTFTGGEGREHNIAYFATGSFFRAISSESSGKGKSGYLVHCALLDEIHEHPTGNMVEFLRAGTKGRRQPLILMITNSGVDRTSVCFDYHDYACKVSAGEISDDSFFGYVCAVEDGTREGYPAEDPFTDKADETLGFPRSWLKANPLLGVTLPKKYLEDRVLQAKGMPSIESVTRRLNFCQWVDAASPWIDSYLFHACEVHNPSDFPSEQWLKDHPCFLGIDLSSTLDMTALAQVWPHEGGVYGRMWYWTPAETLLQRATADRAPYDLWKQQGFLETTPKRSIDYSYMVNRISELMTDYTVAGAAFDQYQIKHLLEKFDQHGLPHWIWEGPDKPQGEGLRLIRHGQGYGGGASDSMLWMSQSIRVLEEAVLTGKLRVQYNPVLRWNSASAVLESDAAGNRKWEKRKSTGRIDGIVALSMAIGAAQGIKSPDAEWSVESFSLTG